MSKTGKWLQRAIYLSIESSSRDVNRVKWPNITHVCHHTRRQHSHYVSIIQIPKRLEIISQSVCVHRQHKGVVSSTKWCLLIRALLTIEHSKFEFERVCTICNSKRDGKILYRLYSGFYLWCIWVFEMPRPKTLCSFTWKMCQRRYVHVFRTHGNYHRFLLFRFVNEYVIMRFNRSPFRRQISETQMRQTCLKIDDAYNCSHHQSSQNCRRKPEKNIVNIFRTKYNHENDKMSAIFSHSAHAAFDSVEQTYSDEWIFHFDERWFDGNECERIFSLT